MTANIVLVDALERIAESAMSQYASAGSMAADCKRIAREALAAHASSEAGVPEPTGDLLRWAYQQLHRRSFTDVDDALNLDRLRLFAEHGVEP